MSEDPQVDPRILILKLMLARAIHERSRRQCGAIVNAIYDIDHETGLALICAVDAVTQG